MKPSRMTRILNGYTITKKDSDYVVTKDGIKIGTYSSLSAAKFNILSKAAESESGGSFI